MDSIRVLVSLITKDNDYQYAQAVAAERVAAKLGIRAEIIYAASDAITQSQQLLEAIQARPDNRPHAIVLEPTGTGLQQVAVAAAKANIGWAILNRDVDYIRDVRKLTSAPVFGVSSDHVEIGRMQACQCQQLLPQGGQVLYIQGPSSSYAAHQRTQGMMEAKPKNINIRVLSGQWTESSAYQAAISLMRLRTSRESRLDLVCGQNDVMALGVRKALKEVMPGWSWIQFTGVDGMADTGQRWVNEHILAATIVVPTNTDIALEMLHQAMLSKTQPKEITFVKPKSYPEIEKLTPKGESATLQPV
ncbi:MAG TPA: substrate-binding domain-containing protein [Terriglobales bacterium]|nr:substrate-binding domain-containing protein [Terriglobales bacterium]